MPRRALLLVGVLALTACGGGGGGGTGAKELALGQEATVKHTDINGGKTAPTTTLGITVLDVRPGTQTDLKKAGFQIDAKDKNMTPYYVHVKYANKGNAAIKRTLDVGMEDQDGNLITAVAVFDLGGPPFSKCPEVKEGEVTPGASYTSCSLFLVPPDKKPKRISFLPYNPKHETNFVYWKVA